MNTETIVATFLSAAAFLKKPVQDAAARSVKDLVDAAKYYLRRKFGADSAGAKVLDLALEKPESVMRKGLLVEETAAAKLDTDPELVRLIEELAAVLPAPVVRAPQSVRVNGHHNRVQVAGRDIVQTERHVQRSVITPDERHIDGALKRQLGAIIADVADRLAGADGRPRFGAVHKMLQQKFHVSAFALLPRERFEDALAFLKQQRAIHRSRLRHRNPGAYQQDFFRAIHTRREALGWHKPRLYQFAADSLGLKKPITSLCELGANQLKSLAKCMGRQKENAES